MKWIHFYSSHLGFHACPCLQNLLHCTAYNNCHVWRLCIQILCEWLRQNSKNIMSRILTTTPRQCQNDSASRSYSTVSTEEHWANIPGARFRAAENLEWRHAPVPLTSALLELQATFATKIIASNKFKPGNDTTHTAGVSIKSIHKREKQHSYIVHIYVLE